VKSYNLKLFPKHRVKYLPNWWFHKLIRTTDAHKCVMLLLFSETGYHSLQHVKIQMSRLSQPITVRRCQYVHHRESAANIPTLLHISEDLFIQTSRHPHIHTSTHPHIAHPPCIFGCKSVQLFLPQDVSACQVKEQKAHLLAGTTISWTMSKLKQNVLRLLIYCDNPPQLTKIKIILRVQKVCNTMDLFPRYVYDINFLIKSK
jgi:hypothetical protein